MVLHDDWMMAGGIPIPGDLHTMSVIIQKDSIHSLILMYSIRIIKHSEYDDCNDSNLWLIIHNTMLRIWIWENYGNALTWNKAKSSLLFARPQPRQKPDFFGYLGMIFPLLTIIYSEVKWGCYQIWLLWL